MALSEDWENAERQTVVGPAVAATPHAAALTAPALASDTSSACATSSGSDAQEPPTELQRLQLQKLQMYCAHRGIPCIPSVISRSDFMGTAQESAAAPAAVQQKMLSGNQKFKILLCKKNILLCEIQTLLKVIVLLSITKLTLN